MVGSDSKLYKIDNKQIYNLSEINEIIGIDRKYYKNNQDFKKTSLNYLRDHSSKLIL